MSKMCTKKITLKCNLYYLCSQCLYPNRSTAKKIYAREQIRLVPQ